MTPDLATLKALAETADHECECGDCDWCDAKRELMDIDPSTILALIERVERAEAERDALKTNADKAMCVWCGHIGPKDAVSMMAHMDECETHPIREYLAALGEIERLRAELATAREKALEEAAIVSEAHDVVGAGAVAYRIAIAIRALASKGGR